MKHIYTLLILLACCHCVEAQTTITITADRDNSIYSESGETSNGAGSYLYAGRTGTGLVRRSLLHFDLSSIPAGSLISSASVSLFCNRVSTTGTSAVIALRKLSNDWGEGTSDGGSTGAAGASAATNDATWSNRFYNTSTWTTTGGDFSATVSGSATVAQTGTVAISGNNLVTDVQNWLDNAATNFGWAIVATNESEANSARRFASREFGSVGQRPKLTVTYTSSLPVTLRSFTAVAQQQNALLEWRTNTEINNSHFEVEHSTNGQNFVVVGTVKGSGTSTIEQIYRFTHTAAAGTNYYRLAQYDLNGAVKYSPVVAVNISAGPQLRVAPNPVTSLLYLRNAALLKGASYTIQSYVGQVVKKGVISDGVIDVQILAAGLYAISIRNKLYQTQTTPFLKK